MQSAALLALDGLSCDEVAHVNHVAQLADVAARLYALEELLGLLVEQVETVPRTLQAQVGAHDAHVVGHYLAHLLHALRDEHLLLVGHRALVVPLRHLLVEVVLVYVLQRVLGSSVGVHHSLDERVARQSVAAVQTRARALANGIQALYRRLSVEINLYAAAHVVGSRANGDIVGGDVDAYRLALEVDVREVLLCLGRVLMRNVEAHVVDAVYLHLLVDGTRHDVARS